MSNQTFRAMRIMETAPNQFERRVETRKISELPSGEVLIKVHNSALNYKDALSATGNRGVTRNYPHTPGIDAAGEVVESADDGFVAGQEVIVTSYDLGMNTDGGFAEYIRVPADWVVPKPDNLTLRESMILGTAGFTAALGLIKMEQMGQRPDQGPVLVTGATGGVGSMAVAIFSRAGYEVIAATGKTDAEAYLKSLGANRCINRQEADDQSKKPLLRPQWAGAFDTVGGNTLATTLKACQAWGNVAACGLVASPALHSTVFPFIIKGVNLLGVDSATCPMDLRRRTWDKMAGEWRVDTLEAIAIDTSLGELDPYIERILKGALKGRVVVSL